MLKGAIENKQLTDTFEGIDGHRFIRSELEDPSRPGYLRPELVPIEPQVWSAGAHFGLLTQTGRPMRYVEVKPDPREPRREEAPADLRQRMKAAESALEDVWARIQAVLDERVEAQVKWQRAAQRGDAETYNLMLLREMEAKQRQMDFEPEAAIARKRVADCERELSEWLYDERLKRYAAAKV